MPLKSLTSQNLRSAIANLPAAEEIIAALDNLAEGVHDATFVIGSEVSEKITVSIQLLDHLGNELTQRSSVKVLLLDDANGDAFNTDNYTTIAAGTDGALVEVVADQVLECISENDGDLDIDLTITGAATTYVAVVTASGELVISDAVTHA